MASDTLIFGEVLFDSFPDGSVVLGGAPFNVAWHLQALGDAPLFISRVGDDPLARRVRDSMVGWGMVTAGLQMDSAHPTGRVEVTLEGGEPSYEIRNHSAWDHIDATCIPPHQPDGLLYYGSLALRNAPSRHALETLRQRHRGLQFMDVNLRPPWWTRDQLLADMGSAHWVKLNEEELRLLGYDQGAFETAMSACLTAHGLRGIILTRGAQGASILEADGSFHQVAPERAGHVVDTVGAGDAFTSVILHGLINNRPMLHTMEQAQALASAIVGIRGALPGRADFYQQFNELS